MLALVGPGCLGDTGPSEPDANSMGGIPLPTSGAASGDGSTDAIGDDDDDEELLDVAMGSGGIPCAEGGDCGECVPLEHTPCDGAADNMISAIGLNCPGEHSVEVTTFGNPAAMAVRTGFGNTNTWAPTEGSAFAVLGSGFTTELDSETPVLDSDAGPTFCNDDLGADYDMGAMLPAPIQTTDVGGDCSTNEALLGTGDCSNTIEAQFTQGGAANDYTELRVVADVPNSSNSVSYDFAFFSTEYPFYFGDMFNDMYIGWLESESWTGNISFDAQGNPISLNAGFLDFRDDGGGLAEFAGTCMRQHAGTRWLNSTAPVSPGETVTLVFAVFDLADSILDSYVFLDNFGWGCDGEDTPSTNPIG